MNFIKQSKMNSNSRIEAEQIQSLSKIIEVEANTLISQFHNIDKLYLRFPIHKGNGKKRWIDAPQKKLKATQKKILFRLLYQQKPHHCAHGFVPKRSIVNNAEPHIGKKWVANYDIKNFFPSTKTASMEWARLS